MLATLGVVWVLLVYTGYKSIPYSQEFTSLESCRKAGEWYNSHWKQSVKFLCVEK